MHFEALDDRREAPRRLLRRPAALVLPGPQLLQIRTLDISLGGLAIVAPANPPEGMACGIRLTVPARDGGQVQIEPRVKVIQSLWSATDHGFKVGLRFQGLTIDQTRVLRDLIEG